MADVRVGVFHWHQPDEHAESKLDHLEEAFESRDDPAGALVVLLEAFNLQVPYWPLEDWLEGFIADPASVAYDEAEYIGTLRDLSRRFQVWIVAGFLRVEGRRIENQALLFEPDDGAPAVLHTKLEVEDCDWMKPGEALLPDNPRPIRIADQGFDLGCLICLDLNTRWDQRLLAERPDLVVVPAANRRMRLVNNGRVDDQQALTDVPVAFANQTIEGQARTLGTCFSFLSDDTGRLLFPQGDNFPPEPFLHLEELSL